MIKDKLLESLTIQTGKRKTWVVESGERLSISIQGVNRKKLLIAITGACALWDGHNCQAGEPSWDVVIPFLVTLQDLDRYDKKVPRLGIPECSRRKHLIIELYGWCNLHTGR